MCCDTSEVCVFVVSPYTHPSQHRGLPRAGSSPPSGRQRPSEHLTALKLPAVPSSGLGLCTVWFPRAA